MKILMIMPDAHMHKLRIGSFTRSFREAPLTLTTLAALAPSDQFHFKLIDESIDKVPLDYPADLVAISVITGTACRAYEYAKYFRRRSIPVVLGGVHVTILPGEAAQYADTIVIGMAEKTWPQLLKDFSLNKMKKVYRDDRLPDDFTLKGVPSPRIDLQRRSGYMIPDTVQATRGCKHQCDFCTVPSVWPGFYKRPVSDVISHIQSLPGKYIAFNDVSLVDDREYAKELFTAMIPLKKRWGGLATTMVSRDLELLELMKKSGCIYLLLGMESANQKTLCSISKGFNKENEYREVVKTLHEYGISLQGCFVFGFDEDDSSIFETTVQRVLDLKIDIPRYSIYTPYPGTRLFKRLSEENRILTLNWENYDTMHVVFQPAKMSPEELYRGFKWAYEKTFQLTHIAKRTILQSETPSLINFFGNLCYRIFVKRLYHEERFARPYMT